MRMYSFFALFTAASFYFYYFKKWKWFSLFAVLGLYTHSFFLLILISLTLHVILTHGFNRKYIWLTLKPFLFFLPWLPVLILQFMNSKNSWLFPVDLQLILSALGNLFTGYEGTPGEYWNYTAILSGLIFIFAAIGIIKKRKEGLFFSIPIIFPLLIILGYSVFRRPLYVNRYMIFVTFFEILAISWGIWSVKNKIFRTLSVSFWLILVIYINLAFAQYHQKTDFKSLFAEINKMASKSDFVFTRTPIAYLESAYYFKNKDRVFVYNPIGITIPNYIGITVVFPDVSRSSLPPSPSRTFLVEDDTSYEMIINQ